VAGQSLLYRSLCLLGSHTPTFGQLPSHGVFSPSALEVSKVHSPRGCLPRYVPLSGFLSLLGVFSSRYPPALFHAGNALGVLPSGLLPPVGYETLSGPLTLLPLGAKDASVDDTACVALHGLCPSAELWHPRLQGFAPRRKPFRQLAVLPARCGRCPPGLFFPSRAFSPSATKT
jgi:hypothetical protein